MPNKINLTNVKFRAYYEVTTHAWGVDEPAYLGGPEIRESVGAETVRYHFETEALKADINGIFYYHAPSVTPDTFKTTIHFTEAGYIKGMDGHDGRVMRGDKNFIFSFALAGTALSPRYDIEINTVLTKQSHFANDPNRGVTGISVPYTVTLFRGKRNRGTKKIEYGSTAILFSNIRAGACRLHFGTSAFKVEAFENDNPAIFDYSLTIELLIKKR